MSIWLFILSSVEAFFDRVGVAALGHPEEPLKVPVKAVGGGRR
jgi:hypothetical protein